MVNDKKLGGGCTIVAIILLAIATSLILLFMGGIIAIFGKLGFGALCITLAVGVFFLAIIFLFSLVI